MSEFYLPRAATARDIREVFGEPFVVRTEGDTWDIAPPAVQAFDKLTKTSVVWVRGGR